MLKRRARVLAGAVLAVVRKATEKLRESARKERTLERAQARAAVSAASQSLLGKRVLVTGSTRGIGRSLAEAFAQQGASVVVHGRRAEDARDVAAAIAKTQPGAATAVIGIAADLALAGEGRKLVEQTIAALGGLDIVVNNAGIHDSRRKAFSDTSSEEMHEALNVNVLAAFDVSAAALANMLSQGVPGRIINVSTGAANPANVSSQGIASYGISKFALEGLSLYLAAESEFVTVATLRPGTIDTEMVAALFPLDQRLRMLQPDSMVPPVLHLATAPREKVHGRVFEQKALIEQLGREVSPTTTASNGVGATPN